MSSVDEEDRSTPARIRAAAFAMFARHGIRAATIRMVADEAGVSPALVIHHFGSKHGLRTACDEWLLDRLGRDKSATLDGDTSALDNIGGTLAEYAPHLDYIVAVLAEGGPPADALFDRICAMTDRMVDEGAQNGTIRRPEDRVAWVTTLAAMNCGMALLGPQIARKLGGEQLFDPQVYARYSLALLDLLTNGMFPDDHFLRLTTAALAGQQSPTETTPIPQKDPS